jgi:hypothetical protein
MGLARTALAQGNADRAVVLLEKSRAMFSQKQYWEGLCWVLHQLGYARHMLGDDRLAGEFLHEALTLQHSHHRKRHLAESLERCAWVAADMNQPERAARLFGAADALRKWMGAPLPLGDKPLYDRFLAMAHAALDSDEFEQAWAEGAALSLDAAVAYALAVDS